MTDPATTKLIVRLMESGERCADKGGAEAEHGHPVAAREWFQAAGAAFSAAYELDVAEVDE